MQAELVGIKLAKYLLSDLIQVSTDGERVSYGSKFEKS